MGDGTTVSTTPMEWRAHMRSVAQAHPVTLHESELGRRILQMRDEMKVSALGGLMAGGRAMKASSSRFWDQRTK